MDGPVLQPSQMDQCYSPWKDHCYGSVLFRKQRKYILEAWGWADPKDSKRKKAAGPILAPLLIYFFLLFISLPYVNCASQKGCLFYLRSSLRSSDLPLFYFCGLFPCLLATAILDSFSCFNYLTVWSLVPLPFLNLAWTTGTSWFTYYWSLTWRILSIIC